MSEKEVLLQKLFSNQCTRRELELLFDLIHQDQEAAAPEVMLELLQQMKETPSVDTETGESIRRRVMTIVNETPSAKESKTAALTPRNRKRTWRVFRLAAAILLLLTASALTYLVLKPDKEVFERTAFGEIKEIVLPDGSLATLNGNSFIRYVPQWKEGETRVVYLDGEAHFQVEKKPASRTKFQVITPDLTVEVLGTEFNVNTRREATSVFLEEGKVQVNLGHEIDQTLELQPGEIIRYSASREKLDLPRSTAAEPEVSWKTGVMVFKETPLQEILEKIAEAHALKFSIEGADLANRAFTLALPTENQDTCMSILSKTTGMSIVKEADVFLIRPQGE